MTLKEQHMLSKIRKGDIHSFEQLFHRYQPGLFAYAISLLHKRETAEEVIQDVFYNIWKNKDSLRINKSWKSYLFRAVYNNSMMVLRKQKREQSLDAEIQEPGSEKAWDPLLQLQYSETADIIDKTLWALPDRTREIFLMNRQDGLRYREIAEHLSVSQKTVEAHMGKALKALKNSLTNKGQI